VVLEGESKMQGEPGMGLGGVVNVEVALIPKLCEAGISVDCLRGSTLVTM